MTTLLSDVHIPWLDFLLHDAPVRLLRFSSDESLRAQLPQADMLLVRTVTKIDAATFPEFPSRLKIIGTATAGTDHIDQNHLGAYGVRMIHSPGCNAHSVAEYVATAVLHGVKGDVSKLPRLTAGIIGYGQTGSRTATLLRSFGITCRTCDPMLNESKPGFEHTPLHDALNSDIVSLHVPLTHTGPHPTALMLTKETLKDKPVRMLINAARGGVLNEKDAVTLKKSGHLKNLTLDVWQNEPDLQSDSLEAADLATPHIAGYSEQGKIQAARMVLAEAGRLLGFRVSDAEPEQKLPGVIDARNGLYSAIQKLHPAFELDGKLRKRPADFTRLRNTHPLRMEFRYHRLSGLPESDRKVAAGLGFKLLK